MIASATEKRIIRDATDTGGFRVFRRNSRQVFSHLNKVSGRSPVLNGRTRFVSVARYLAMRPGGTGLVLFGQKDLTMKLSREALGLIYNSCMGHCYYCGLPQEVFGDWEVDHMTPRQQNGPDEFCNFVLACKSCNRRKGNRTVEQYRSYLAQRLLNTITLASELVADLNPTPGTDAAKTLEHLIEAEDLAENIEVVFFGEANNILRKTDPLFTNTTENGGDTNQ